VSNSVTAPVPVRRTADLVVRAQDDETLVLDTRTDTVHCLPTAVVRVWDACTSGRTLRDVITAAEVDEGAAAGAIDQLLALDLLEVPAGIDRRWFLRRSALVGAGAIAAPIVIQSVVAPPAFAAGSHVTGTVTQLSCSGGNSGKINYQVSVTAGIPSSSYFPTITYVDGSTITDAADTLSTNASGSGSSTGQSTTHLGAVSVTLRLYTDAAHTQLVYTSSPIPLAGCP
jgi:hypothetical protein